MHQHSESQLRALAVGESIACWQGPGDDATILYTWRTAAAVVGSAEWHCVGDDDVLGRPGGAALVGKRKSIGQEPACLHRVWTGSLGERQSGVAENGDSYRVTLGDGDDLAAPGAIGSVGDGRAVGKRCGNRDDKGGGDTLPDPQVVGQYPGDGGGRVGRRKRRGDIISVIGNSVDDGERQRSGQVTGVGDIERKGQRIAGLHHRTARGLGNDKVWGADSSSAPGCDLCVNVGCENGCVGNDSPIGERLTDTHLEPLNSYATRWEAVA